MELALANRNNNKIQKHQSAALAIICCIEIEQRAKDIQQHILGVNLKQGEKDRKLAKRVRAVCVLLIGHLSMRLCA